MWTRLECFFAAVVEVGDGLVKVRSLWRGSDDFVTLPALRPSPKRLQLDALAV